MTTGHETATRSRSKMNLNAVPPHVNIEYSALLFTVESHTCCAITTQSKTVEYVCATGLKGIPKRLVLSVSRYSFLIYLFHELNLTVLKKLLANLLPLTIPFQIAEYFCVPCIILLFCTGLSILLERIAPGVFVILNGGRALRYTKNR